MRILVMGSGGIGGYFGARLAASGEDVRFVARGAHLEAMRSNGLRLDSQVNPVTIKPVRASADPAELGPDIDLVVIAVKLWGSDAAIEAVRPVVGPGTAVVSFQNGIGAIDMLSKAFGREHVLGGVAHIATAIGAPGVIKHTGTMERLTIGEPDGGISARVSAFVDIAKRAKLNAIAADDIQRAIWEKFVFLASFSGVTTLTRLPKEPILADADMRRLYADALAEAVAVARARGIALPADQAARTLEFSDGLAPTMKSSMLHDLEAGNRLELDWLSGAVVRLGTEAGVPTPAHRAIYAGLKPYIAGRPA
jgi:2-dehydropantoate 2-reductase